MDRTIFRCKIPFTVHNYNGVNHRIKTGDRLELIVALDSRPIQGTKRVCDSGLMAMDYTKSKKQVIHIRTDRDMVIDMVTAGFCCELLEQSY